MKTKMKSFSLNCVKICVILSFIVEFVEHGGFLNFRKALGFGKKRHVDETIKES